MHLPIRLLIRGVSQVPSVADRGGGSATLRIVADNPGVWLFHCMFLSFILVYFTTVLFEGHIEWHLESGLALQLIEAPLQAQEAAKSTYPSILNSHCAALKVPYTGNAAGHNSTTDLSGLKVGPYPQRLGWHSKGIGAMAGCVLTALCGMCSAEVWMKGR